MIIIHGVVVSRWRHVGVERVLVRIEMTVHHLLVELPGKSIQAAQRWSCRGIVFKRIADDDVVPSGWRHIQNTT